MKKNNIFNLVFMALIFAIIIILTFTNLGYIPLFGTVQITIIVIPVIVGAIIMGRKYAYLIGLMFGLSSLVYAIMNYGLLTAPVFVNPLVSVLPRVIFGFIAFELFSFFQKILNKKEEESGTSPKKIALAVSLSAMLSCLAHTIMVVVMLGLFRFMDPNLASTTFFGLVKANISLNALLEIILSGLVVPVIVIGIKKARGALE